MFRIVILIASLVSLAACGIDSVTRAEIEAVKPGSKITYRYAQDRTTWFYADKVTRVEGDTIYYNPSLNESTSGSDTRLDEYDTTRELSIKMVDLLKYERPQPPHKTTIISIE